jgi:hypothetical protein
MQIGMGLEAGTPHPAAVYQTYRSMALQPPFLDAVSRGIDDLPLLATESLDDLAPKGHDDLSFRIGSSPETGVEILPRPAQYPGFVASEELRALMTRLCLARLASTVKSIAICATRDLAPYTSDSGIAAVIQLLNANTASLVGDRGASDERALALRRLALLHDIVLAEFIDPIALNAMSVSDVIRLRTKAWGKARENRTALAASLRQIALENPKSDEFQTACRKALRQHEDARSDWHHEIRKLGVRVVCDLGTYGLSAAAGVGLVDKVIPLGSLGTVLLLGSAAARLLKEPITQVLDLLHKETVLERLPGYAIVSPYRPFVDA